MSQHEQEKQVPLGTTVPESVRRRVRVLAARSDKNMSKVTREAFDRGLEILEKEQEERESA